MSTPPYLYRQFTHLVRTRVFYAARYFILQFPSKMELPTKKIAKFPDLTISGTAQAFAVSKSAMDSGSSHFRSILVQAPDLASYKVDIPVSDSAIETVLAIMHGGPIHLVLDADLVDAVHLVLRWDASPAVKRALVSRLAGKITAANSLVVWQIASSFGCEELVAASNAAIQKAQGAPAFGLEENKEQSMLGVRLREQEERCQQLEEKNTALEERVAKLEERFRFLEERLVVPMAPKPQPMKKDPMGIVPSDMVETLEEWIRETEPADISPVRFELLYRGSTDGMTAKHFHSKCDNQGATVVVVLSSSGQLFGGYTSSPWAGSESYAWDGTAFLFSLTKRTKCPLKSGEESHATYLTKEHGPTFGKGFDLVLTGKFDSPEAVCYTNGGASYRTGKGDPKRFFAGSNCFSVKEVEVYRVLRDRWQANEFDL